MCGFFACKAYSVDLKVRVTFLFLTCICLEFNVPAFMAWRSFVFVTYFMFYVVECV